MDPLLSSHLHTYEPDGPLAFQTPSALAEAVQQALTDEAMQARAKQLGHRLGLF